MPQQLLEACRRAHREGARVFGCKLSGLASHMGAARANRAQVGLLRGAVDAPQRHVFDHAVAQWMDLRRVGHGWVSRLGSTRAIRAQPSDRRR